EPRHGAREIAFGSERPDAAPQLPSLPERHENGPGLPERFRAIRTQARRRLAPEERLERAASQSQQIPARGVRQRPAHRNASTGSSARKAATADSSSSSRPSKKRAAPGTTTIRAASPRARRSISGGPKASRSPTMKIAGTVGSPQERSA